MRRLTYEKTIDMLLPNCFFLSMFVSIIVSVVLYPLVHDNETVRILISGGVNGIITALLAFSWLHIFKKSSNKKGILVSAIPMLFLPISFLFSFAKYGVKSGTLLSFAVAILFSAQFYLVAVHVLEKEKKKTLVKNFDFYGICLIIFSVIYILRFFFSDGENLNSFCGMTYMSIAYVYMVISIIFIFKIIFLKEKGKWFWKYWSLLIYFITMIYTGTRGAVVCTIFFFVVFALYWLINKDVISAMKTLGWGSIFLALLFFSIYVWSPEGSGSAGRMQDFDYDKDIYNSQVNSIVSDQTETRILTEKGSYVTITNVVLQDIYAEYIIRSDKNIEESLKELSSNETEEGQKILIASEKTEEAFRKYKLYMGRNLLAKFSIEEFKKSPIYGNGPMYYINKYNNYSHNILTDILCDFGIGGIAVFLTLMVALLIINVKSILADKFTAIIAILSLTMCASFMLSNNMYEGGIWIFLCSFAILNFMKNKGVKDEIKC